MHDAIVIGGGIVGASTAYHLASDGAETLLVDRRDPGRATDAGAGIVAPEAGADPAPFALAAAEYYPDLLDRLEAETDVDPGFDRPGRLLVATEASERPALDRTIDAVLERAHGPRPPSPEHVSELSPAEAAERFPPLTDVHGALYYDHGGRVDGQRMERALLDAGRAHGLETLEADAEEIVVSDGVATGVVADGETIEAATVVIAGGAWSERFGDHIGIRVPVSPQRGQIAHLDLRGTDTAGWPVVNGFGDHYLVPWPDSRVAAGATRESDAGYAPHTTAAGVREVLDEALDTAPGLADASIQEVRVGLRPLSRDGRPIIGEAGVEGAYLATGHGPVGLTLGPFTGRCVADLIVDGSAAVDLSPFSPDRFDA